MPFTTNIPSVAAVVLVPPAVFVDSLYTAVSCRFLPSRGGVGNHTASSHDLGQITTGHHRRRLIIDATFEAGRTPIHELDRTSVHQGIPGTYLEPSIFWRLKNPSQNPESFPHQNKGFDLGSRDFYTQNTFDEWIAQNERPWKMCLLSLEKTQSLPQPHMVFAHPLFPVIRGIK